MRLNSPSVSTNCVDPLFSPHLHTGKLKKRTISLMGDSPPPLLLASKNIRARRHSATEQTHRQRHITFQGSCFQNKTRSLASLTLVQLDLGLPSSHLHSVHASNDLTQNNLTMQFFLFALIFLHSQMPVRRVHLPRLLQNYISSWREHKTLSS